MRLKFILFALFFILVFALAPASVDAQSCTAPAAATGVSVEYPGCSTSTSCDTAQASCAWNAQADAVSFNITVTEVETGTLIKNNESQPASATKVLFAISQGKTYKCDVVAASSCGSLAAMVSDQLLCEADALIETPTPTTAVAAPTATSVPVVTKPPVPVSGGPMQTFAVLGGIFIVIIGGILLFAL